MAIVKMKKLRVMAMASDRDGLMDELLHLGCVEISEPGAQLADPKWSALLHRGTSSLLETRSRITDVNTALDAIKQYGNLKEGLFVVRRPISEREFLSADTAEHARAAAGKINGLLQALTKLQSEESPLLSARASLLPWSGLDLPLECSGTEHVLYRMGVCPGATDVGKLKTELAASDAAAEIFDAGGDKQQRYLLLICLRADEEKAMEVLRTRSFSAVAFPGYSGTAQANLERLDREIEQNRGQQKETETALTACAEYRDALRVYADRLSADAELNSDKENTLTDGTIVFFEGWAPADSMQAVGRVLDEKGCAWEAADPTPEEYPDVPVKLKNNKLTRALNMVTEMYSLPAYDGVDPNPLMTPFFILFYGIMMGDMGYGALMILASVLINKKYRPKGTAGHLFTLMGYCGVSAFIFGALTGGFFGDFLTQLIGIIHPGSTFALPSLFTPLNDTLMILIGSMCLGFVQINVGMAVSFVEKIRHGEIMDAVWEELTWWVVFAGIAVAVLAKVNLVLYVGLAMVLVGSGWNAKGFGKVTAVFSSLYSHVTGYFGDVLSYSRLMALMLSGSVIAQVFNTLGAIPGNIVIFLIIATVGNTLNFALNLLSCYVHDLRLQCLEYFGKFYKDGGKPFQPLAMNTKYVDIENN